jgi:hypothetical protein
MERTLPRAAGAGLPTSIMPRSTSTLVDHALEWVLRDATAPCLTLCSVLTANGDEDDDPFPLTLGATCRYGDGGSSGGDTCCAVGVGGVGSVGGGVGSASAVAASPPGSRFAPHILADTQSLVRLAQYLSQPSVCASLTSLNVDAPGKGRARRQRKPRGGRVRPLRARVRL